MVVLELFTPTCPLRLSELKQQHLNVVNPLWQGVSNLDDDYANLSKMERFTALLHRADDTTRQYYHSLRGEFYRLKDSPNPALRVNCSLRSLMVGKVLHTL